MWGAVKVVLQGKFMAINTYIRKEQSPVNSLSIHLKKKEKQEQLNPDMQKKENDKKIVKF